MSTYQWAVGERVAAILKVTEENFRGEHEWVHADVGDKGEVIHVDEDGFPSVVFDKAGTITVVDHVEIKSLGMCVCSRCKKPTTLEGIYMVTDEVWLKANNGSTRGVMHIRCVQEAIGRPLTIEDFPRPPEFLQFGYEMGLRAR